MPEVLNKMTDEVVGEHYESLLLCWWFLAIKSLRSPRINTMSTAYKTNESYTVGLSINHQRDASLKLGLVFYQALESISHSQLQLPWPSIWGNASTKVVKRVVWL